MMWYPVKTLVGYVLFLVVVVGGSGKQARGGECLQKGPFMATKWAQNGVIIVGLDL